MTTRGCAVRPVGSVALYCEMAPHMRSGRSGCSDRHRGLEVLPADVVEVDVDPVGAQPPPGAPRRGRRGSRRRRRSRGRAGRATFAGEPALPMTREAPRSLGDLADEAADRAGGAGDEDGVGGLQPGDAAWPAHAVSPAYPARRGTPAAGASVGVDRRVAVAASRTACSRQPRPCRTVVAHPPLGRPGGDDLADGAAVERLAERERRRVGLHVVHPAPHVRVDGHGRVADQRPVRPRARVRGPRRGGSSPASANPAAVRRGGSAGCSWGCSCGLLRHDGGTAIPRVRVSHGPWFGTGVRARVRLVPLPLLPLPLPLPGASQRSAPRPATRA